MSEPLGNGLCDKSMGTHGLVTPSPRPLVAYLRVSTDKQGRSGLGIEAQREGRLTSLRAELLPALPARSPPPTANRHLHEPCGLPDHHLGED